MTGHRRTDGSVHIEGTARPPKYLSFPQEYFTVPCGNCLGCQVNNNRQWAIRCHLEMWQHDASSVVTLTYNERHLPPTLQKKHVQMYMQNVRSRIAELDKDAGKKTPRKIKHFACGEYGDERKRPHYHVILFGIHKDEINEIQKPRQRKKPGPVRGPRPTATHSRRRPSDAEKRGPDTVPAAWPLGTIYSDSLTPEAIAYVAGYVNKKRSQQIKTADAHERVSKDGECYRYQPPFRLMSLRPGIGQLARNEFRDSWRKTAVWHGVQVAVPKYLHAGWLETATEQEKQELQDELTREAIKSLHHKLPRRLHAAEQIALNKHARQTSARGNGT